MMHVSILNYVSSCRVGNSRRSFSKPMNQKPLPSEIPFSDDTTCSVLALSAQHRQSPAHPALFSSAVALPHPSRISSLFQRTHTLCLASAHSHRPSSSPLALAQPQVHRAH